jgi:hypothetical protein
MALSKATRVWLDGVAEGSDHEARCACEVFAALESGDGVVSAKTQGWLRRMSNQRKYPLVRNWSHTVFVELNRLRK